MAGDIVLRVTPDVIKNEKLSVDTSVNGLNQTINKMYQYKDALIASGHYQSKSAKVFSDRMESYRKTFEELVKLLTRYGVHLEKAGTRYNMNEDMLKDKAGTLPGQ